MDYNPFDEQDEFLNGDVYEDLIKANNVSNDTPLFDIDSIIANMQNTRETFVPYEVEALPVATVPDINLSAMMEEQIDKARENIGIEVDEQAFYDKVSSMNTFARLSVLVDEINKDPTQWYLYLYLKHTGYHLQEETDDYSVPLAPKTAQESDAGISTALNNLEKNFGCDPLSFTLPSVIDKFKKLKNNDSLRVTSTVGDLKRKNLVHYESDEESNQNHLTHTLASLNETGLNFVKMESKQSPLLLSLDDKLLIGGDNSPYKIKLTSFDGSANIYYNVMNSVLVRRSTFSDSVRNLTIDIRSVRPFDSSGVRYYGMDVTEFGGFRTLKSTLNRMKIPYLYRQRKETGINFLAIPHRMPNRIYNAIFYRNLKNSCSLNKLPFNAYNMWKYFQAIPGADLLNFAFQKNINGTIPCDGYCSRYFNSITQQFRTPDFMPIFKPSNGRCMNILECSCFVPNYQDILSLSNLYLTFDGGKQVCLGIKKHCIFCGTSYYGESCTNAAHKIRTATRLKAIQSKFKNIEENLKDPCAECGLILRRVNSTTPGAIIMEEHNIVNYEFENPNVLLLTTLLEHYGGSKIVYDKESKEFFSHLTKEVAFQEKVCNMANYDDYREFVCTKPLCGRIAEWKRLSAIADTILATQIKVQDSDQNLNNPDDLLELLGFNEKNREFVNQKNAPYLGGQIQDEVRKISKRLNTDTTAVAGTKFSKQNVVVKKHAREKAKNQTSEQRKKKIDVAASIQSVIDTALTVGADQTDERPKTSNNA